MSQEAKKNLQDLAAKDYLSPQASAMRGFEPQYRDIVDYIVRITHRIWEEADMGYIYDTYSHNCTVHTAYGVSYGVEAVVSGSIAVLAGFPDRRMYAEDVIWAGDDEAGFHTSHLIMNTATNTGYSAWAGPSGKQVRYFAIANCFVRENRISEEWLVRDTSAVIRQLGLDIWQLARAAANHDAPQVFGETDRLSGQLPPTAYQPEATTASIEVFVRALFDDVWNGRHFNRIAECYLPDALMWVPNHVQIRGISNIKAYHLGLIAMFPDAHMNVEQVYWLGSDEQGYRVALRWRLAGTHQAFGFYGQPSGKRINVLGVSHVHIKDQRISRHHCVFDELALIMQLVN